MSTASAHPHKNIAWLYWVAFVLMFFALQACLWTYAISATSRDMSHAVVAGYDEQALTWDEVKQAKTESAKLGWKSEVLIGKTADLHDNRSLTIQLVDRSEKPIENANFKVTAFHRAAAAEPQNIRFREVAPGVYASAIEVERFGKWCFSGSATVRGMTFLLDETVLIQEPTPNLTRSAVN